ncbi:MAG: polysaccharide biosynthesis/export family protein [Leptolyngbyaceae cyanobacterium]
MMLRSMFYRCSQVLLVGLGLIALTPTILRAQTVPNLLNLEPSLDRANDGICRSSLDPVSLSDDRDCASSPYLLGPGDQIEVTVYGNAELTGARLILPDNTITLPLVGQVPAGGRTTDQLTADLTAILNQILVDPDVSVTLSSLRPVVVNVSGEVYRPGPMELQPMNRDRNTGLNAPPSVSMALVQAGGVTQTADLREVMVTRDLPNGETVRILVNLWDALWAETVPDALVLRDGDTIFVPTLADGDLNARRLITSSSLSPSTVIVRVVGEVTQPGQVEVAANSSLSGAIAVAGGPTNDAKLRETVFIRLNETGEVEQEIIDLSELNDNYQIQNGDVIVVPKTRTTSVLDFAQRLINPLGLFFRLLD